MQKDNDNTRMKIELDQAKKIVFDNKTMKSHQGLLNNDLTAKLKSYEIQKNQLDERNQALEKELERMTVESAKSSKPAGVSDSDLDHYVNYKK